MGREGLEPSTLGSRGSGAWTDPGPVKDRGQEEELIQVEQWAEIRRMHFVEGVAIKEIVRRTGRDRKTARRAIRSEQPPRYERKVAASSRAIHSAPTVTQPAWGRRTCARGAGTSLHRDVLIVRPPVWGLHLLHLFCTAIRAGGRRGPSSSSRGLP